MCKTASNMQHFFFLIALANNWPIKSKVCQLVVGRFPAIHLIHPLLLLVPVHWPLTDGHCMPGAHFVAICVPPFSPYWAVANKGGGAIATRYVFYADCQAGLSTVYIFDFRLLLLATFAANRRHVGIANSMELFWGAFSAIFHF